MTETVFALVSSWGPWVIFASAFLSCLALPIPTSLMMLTGGAFAAAGDLALWQVVAAAFGLALLLPVIPFSLEMLALRRLTTAAFGTLMSLEPAFGLLMGLLLLSQIPDAGQVVGVALVVAAGIGAERSGHREVDPMVPLVE